MRNLERKFGDVNCSGIGVALISKNDVERVTVERLTERSLIEKLQVDLFFFHHLSQLLFNSKFFRIELWHNESQRYQLSERSRAEGTSPLSTRLRMRVLYSSRRQTATNESESRQTHLFLEVDILDFVSVLLELLDDRLNDVLELSPSNEKV